MSADDLNGQSWSIPPFIFCRRMIFHPLKYSILVKTCISDVFRGKFQAFHHLIMAVSIELYIPDLYIRGSFLSRRYEISVH